MRQDAARSSPAEVTLDQDNVQGRLPVRMVLDTLCIEVTARCPLRCVHCSAEASPERSEFFPVEIYASLVRELSRIDAIYLSGGEPFEHPDLERFVEFSRRTSSEVVIYSSGTQRLGRRAIPLSEERLAGIAMHGLSRVDFSIYSNRADEHDAVTKTSGSFTATLASIRLCRALGIQFGVHFVPLVEGGLRVRAVAGLARELRSSRFHVLAVVSQGRGARLSATLTPGFLADVATIHDDPGFNLVLSSAIRNVLGRGSTPRDKLRSAFIDVHGTVHPSEGRRLPIYGAPLARLDTIVGQLEAMP